MRTSVTSNANALAVRSRMRKDLLMPAIQAVERTNGEAMAKRAQMLSQGVFSSTALRKMGHPYALRSPAPPGDPALINRQSSLFQASWKFVVDRQGDVSVLTVFNDAPYSKFMRGTKFEIARPILERMTELEQANRIGRLRAAFGRVVKGS